MPQKYNLLSPLIYPTNTHTRSNKLTHTHYNLASVTWFIEKLYERHLIFHLICTHAWSRRTKNDHIHSPTTFFSVWLLNLLIVTYPCPVVKWMWGPLGISWTLWNFMQVFASYADTACLITVIAPAKHNNTLTFINTLIVSE